MKTAITIDDAAHIKKDDVFNLDGAYHQMLVETQRDDRQGYFHPSSVGMCGRKNVYEYIRAPCATTTDPKSLEIFDLGHAIHALVGEKLTRVGEMLRAKNFGYEFEQEKKFDPQTDRLFVDFGIGGTTDGVLKIWADDWVQRSVLETKSAGKDGFDKISAPKEDHLMQAHLYCYRWDCPIMYIWYYGKNNSERKVYPYVFDQDILLAALKRYEGWLGHVDAGTLPEQEEDYYNCPRCEYAHTVCHPPVLTKLRNKTNKTASKAAGKAEASLRARGRLRRMR